MNGTFLFSFSVPFSGLLLCGAIRRNDRCGLFWLFRQLIREQSSRCRRRRLFERAVAAGACGVVQHLVVEREAVFFTLRGFSRPCIRVPSHAKRTVSSRTDHRDDGMIGYATLARTVIVENVTKPKLALLHQIPRKNSGCWRKRREVIKSSRATRMEATARRKSAGIYMLGTTRAARSANHALASVIAAATASGCVD
jgi:hypothetical protein